MDQKALKDGEPVDEKDFFTKEEMNLVEYPVALVSDRAPKGVKTIEYRDWVVVDGARKPLSWILTGSDQFGLPAGVDQDFYIATMEVWRESGFKDQTIPIGSIYHMLTRMKMDRNGRTYRRFKLYLDRYSTVSVIAENAFWDKDGQCYRSREKFGIFDSYRLVERFPRKNEPAMPLPLGYIKASDLLYRSVRNGNLKDLNLTLYLKLRTPLARRLYRYLDKKRYHGRSFKINVRRFAGKLGLLPSAVASYRPAKLRQLLIEPLDQLVQEEFLERYAFESGKEGEKLVVVFTRPGEPSGRMPHREQDDAEGTDAELAYLLTDILAFTGDEHSRAYYAQLVRELPRQQVYAILSESRQAHREGKINTTKAKYFTDLAERYRGRKPL